MANTLNSAQRWRILLFSLGAALLYGGWAAFANREHGLRRAVLSGLVQGVMSCLSTALLTSGIEWVFQREAPGARRLLIAGLGPSLSVILLMSGIHWLIHTPEILHTILPSLLIGTLFSFSYTLGLTRQARLTERAVSS